MKRNRKSEIGEHINRDFEKIKKIINSCTETRHITRTGILLHQFRILYQNHDEYYRVLYDLKEKKFDKIINKKSNGDNAS